MLFVCQPNVAHPLLLPLLLLQHHMPALLVPARVSGFSWDSALCKCRVSLCLLQLAAKLPHQLTYSISAVHRHGCTGPS